MDIPQLKIGIAHLMWQLLASHLIVKKRPPGNARRWSSTVTYGVPLVNLEIWRSYLHDTKDWGQGPHYIKHGSLNVSFEGGA